MPKITNDFHPVAIISYQNINLQLKWEMDVRNFKCCCCCIDAIPWSRKQSANESCLHHRQWTDAVPGVAPFDCKRNGTYLMCLNSRILIRDNVSFSLITKLWSGVCSWPLTFIQCRHKEYVQLYLHSPILHGIVLSSVQGHLYLLFGGKWQSKRIRSHKNTGFEIMHLHMGLINTEELQTTTVMCFERLVHIWFSKGKKAISFIPLHTRRSSNSKRAPPQYMYWNRLIFIRNWNCFPVRQSNTETLFGTGHYGHHI